MKTTMKKKIGLGVLGLVGLSVLTAGGAVATDNLGSNQVFDADKADKFGDSKVFGEEAHKLHKKHIFMHNEDVQAAIEANDYDAFIEAIEDINEKAAEMMTEERFEDIVEKYQIHQEIKDAIAAGSYDAWVEAVSQLPHGDDLIELIDEDEFEVLMNLHEAREAGDHETAKELAQELGLPGPWVRR